MDYMLIFPAVAVVFLSVHLQFLGEHVWRGLTSAYNSLPKTQEEDSTGHRLVDRLTAIRVSNFRTVTCLTVNVTVGMLLTFSARILREPTAANAVILLVLLAVYCMDAAVASGRLKLTGKEMMGISCNLCFLIHTMSFAMSFLSTTTAAEHMISFSLVSMAHLLAGLVFLQAWIWIPSTVLLSVTHLVMYVYKFGLAEVSVLFSANHVAQLLSCLLILTAAEHGVRTLLKSQVDKEDDRTLMAGFQKILKGLCDGSLLLDSKMLVHGSPSCLQRLLCTQKSFEGIAFSSLITSPEKQESFTTFLNTSVSSQAVDAEASLPSCLRVALSKGDVVVPVDVFHAVLPGLFGGEEPYHILALVEDSAGREATTPQSSQQRSSAPWPFSFENAAGPASSRASRAASTASARGNEVLEVVQELAEATFLVDPCSDNLDVLEAHLKFNREPPVHIPPCLRMLSKINDWDHLQSKFRSYALGLLNGAPDVPVALHAMQIRVPGAPRKLLKARQVRLSLANRSRMIGSPIFLYLHLKHFNKKDARPTYAKGLQNEAVEEQPDDDSGYEAEEQVQTADDSEDGKEQIPNDGFQDEKEHSSSSKDAKESNSEKGSPGLLGDVFIQDLIFHL